MNIQQTTSFIGKRKNENFFVNTVEILIELFQLYTGLEIEKHSIVQPKDYYNASSSFIVDILTIIPDI